MKIYKILQRCLYNNKSLKITVYNKYQTYSFLIVNKSNKYYLFFNEKLIDVLTFCSYILTFETFISTDTNLYSDCFLDFSVISSLSNPLQESNYKENALSNLGIDKDLLKNSINNSYQKFCRFNNILRFPKETKINAIKNYIYKILNDDKNENSMVMQYDTFFRLLANKIVNDFNTSRDNLISLFANTMLNNEELIVIFNLRNIDYRVKFSFTSANNLQVEINMQNTLSTYIGPEAFAVLYTLSAIYSEDYETCFSFQKVPSSIKRTNRQIFLNACLLNELINQNKENGLNLLEIVHDYYPISNLVGSNLLSLFMDIKEEIKGDSEFQDYTQNTTTMQNWIKKNSIMLLTGSDTASFISDNPKSTVANTNKGKNLVRKPKLIYWPNEIK